ncbi:MAG: amino acid ABC transporter permease [Anaerolineae bacterium]|jgi:polar amino acid transport system permease protein|nr:amino acid ABC transporter permease [Anaerolineae bacterium]
MSVSPPPSEPAAKSFSAWRFYRSLYNIPWWGVILAIMGIWVGSVINSNPDYSTAFGQLMAAVPLTLVIGLGSYAVALVIGLLIGLIRSSPPKPASTVAGIPFSIARTALYHLATVYVEIIRGTPMVTFLLLAAFVLIPYIRTEILRPAGIELPFRGTSVEVGIIGLALAYGAFMSETFRAGIQSIEKGQVEAARALGLSFFQVMRHVVLPQAIRRILPPLGNDLVSMIKDSALVGVTLAQREVTQTASVIAGSNFKYQAYLITAAVIYLFLTITLSLIVKWVEQRMKMNTR